MTSMMKCVDETFVVPATIHTLIDEMFRLFLPPGAVWIVGTTAALEMIWLLPNQLMMAVAGAAPASPRLIASAPVLTVLVIAMLMIAAVASSGITSTAGESVPN